MKRLMNSAIDHSWFKNCGSVNWVRLYPMIEIREAGKKTEKEIDAILRPHAGLQLESKTRQHLPQKFTLKHQLQSFISIR